jgi:hypothetical protein
MAGLRSDLSRELPPYPDVSENPGSGLHQTNVLAENTREHQLTFWRLGKPERLFFCGTCSLPPADWNWAEPVIIHENYPLAGWQSAIRGGGSKN